MLSISARPVNRTALVRTLSLAGAASAIAVAVLGVRPEWITIRALRLLVVKLLFTGCVVGLAPPGGDPRTLPLLVALPFVAIVFLALVIDAD